MRDENARLTGNKPAFVPLNLAIAHYDLILPNLAHTARAQSTFQQAQAVFADVRSSVVSRVCY